MNHNKVVIFVGVLTEYQGVDLLLDAIPQVVRRIPDVRFVIVGYPNEQQYRKKAQVLRVDQWTHFTGKISYEEVPRYLSLADVAVSPKISTSEANLKLFTYMAMGLPTVVFDTPVNREILGDVGVYAKMGDVNSLAESLIGILDDQDWARDLGARSRQKAALEYSWLRVGMRLGDIYQSISELTSSNGETKERSHEQIKDTGNGRSRFYGLPFSKPFTRPGARRHGPG
jgi:glycosyltransferase involved in cell wall biosynthesis